MKASKKRYNNKKVEKLATLMEDTEEKNKAITKVEISSEEAR